MPRLIPLAACATALLVCSGCVARNFGEHLEQLRPGLTLTEVQAVLGPPNTVMTNRANSAWLYCDDYFDLRPHTTVTVWFTDRRMIDVSVYDNQPAVTCQDFQQTFTWDRAPYAGEASFK